ncbi:flagellar basal body-associated FliL family protein [Xinfangfangia pollutisoli]|uniref:flagellar basal body-associated FliL family protein n=1 Tax=Xinfangfangia pollutisoli TaxID=2865960 RepID=UPI001CD7272E|nr:flagellar basal body-associated FliL family protein [Xinfangfangia pollutisoli]
MIRMLLPILLALLGLGGGIGAGLALRPAEEEGAKPAEEEHVAEDPETKPDYVKLNNQFVVPVLEGGRVASMVVMSLSLEMQAGHSEDVYAREPKIRDAFLQVLFDHANTGGFRGSFTDGSNLVLLRQALKEKAVSILGPTCTNVLITEIARQDS